MNDYILKYEDMISIKEEKISSHGHEKEGLLKVIDNLTKELGEARSKI